MQKITMQRSDPVRVAGIVWENGSIATYVCQSTVQLSWPV